MLKRTLTFFLIDDDEDDQELFQLALQDANPEIKLTTASNGVEALKLLESGNLSTDYIFLDLNMPLMGGKECLVHLKANPLLKTIPVIIFSTSSDASDKKKLSELGAVDFITKPSRIGDLTLLLNQFIEHQVHKTYLI
jgi:CheY-like chemotaxis protein